MPLRSVFKRSIVAFAVIITALITAFFVCSTPVTAHAASTDLTATSNDLVKFANKKTVTLPFIKNRLQRCNERALYWDGSSAITNLKSSNPKVASVSFESEEDEDGIHNVLEIKLKRVGKAKISFTYNGKKRSTVLNVVKYQNPLKSFKVGNKEYASYFNPTKVRGTIQNGSISECEVCLKDWKLHNSLVSNTSKSKKTLKVALNKGWKLVKITRFIAGYKTTKIKNGGKFFMPEYSFLYITVKNAKTGLKYDLRATMPLVGF